MRELYASPLGRHRNSFSHWVQVDGLKFVSVLCRNPANKEAAALVERESLQLEGWNMLGIE